MPGTRFHRVGVESEELLSSIDAAFSSTEFDRGGLALVEQIDAQNVTEFCQELASVGGLWAAFQDEKLVAWALVQDRVIIGVFVLDEFRRQGVAKAFIQHLLETDNPPVDAFALPGDRATKSLYESIGWKARLLTMRG
jgi:GNAT superfamily N-acetyltransferase